MITSLASCSQVFIRGPVFNALLHGLAVKDHKLDDIVKIVKIDITENKKSCCYRFLSI